MILADTSVWIDHLRNANPSLAQLLDDGQVMSHPAVIGELACGTFRDRSIILNMLHELPQVMEAQHEEVLAMIEQHALMGRGIGWIDAHLLAAALLSDVQLWTLDRRLAETARRMSIIS